MQLTYGKEKYKKTSRHFIGVVFFIASFAFGIFYYNPPLAENPIHSGEPIRLVRTTWPGHIVSSIALKKGFFKENSVLVELDIKEEYMNMLTAFKYESRNRTEFRNSG